VNGATNGLEKVQLDSDSVPLTDSPESASPVTSTVPGPPKQPTSAPGVIERQRKPRPTSMYSQWDEEDGGESSEDEAAFLTPDEGLSEFEEEEEPVKEESGAANSGATHRTPMAADVEKGTDGAASDVDSTGPSTVHRSIPSSGETRVRRRTPNTKHDAHTLDQAAVLSGDLDICREILRLFLTSKMKEAEDMCFEKDPDGNHLYLISAHGIIQALKVWRLVLYGLQLKNHVGDDDVRFR